MYSYPLFAILSATSDVPDTEASSSPPSTCDDAWYQFRVLYEHCGQPSGLLAHGFDAFKNHTWANPVTGASPVIWGRALAWYTLGLLNVLQSPALNACSPIVKEQLSQLIEDILEPQLTAAEHSRVLAGQRYGVWQVVDRPFRPGNFVESSASFLTVYSLLRAAKLGLVPEERTGRLSVTELATGIFYWNLQNYLVEHENGTVSLEGTSTVASLRDDVVDYEVRDINSDRRRAVSCSGLLTGFSVLHLEACCDEQLAGNECLHTRCTGSRERRGRPMKSDG